MTIFEHCVYGDVRGKLISLEEHLNVPFSIKRTFFIYDVPNDQTRGEHAHVKTKQYISALNGSCKITLDNGKDLVTYSLNSPNVGLFQDTLVWGRMFDFSHDCILLVLASETYNPEDYIVNYDKFLEAVVQ